jgi:alcohol dehydrogenase
MKALWFEEGSAAVRDVPAPERKAGESLIALRVAGVCRTDIELLKGYMRFAGVPGHEFVGTVMESDDTALAGQRVVGDINVPCGACRACRDGMEKHCPARSVLGISRRPGCFSELFTLPDANLHRVPDGVRDYDAVFAEPLAAALRIEEQVKLARRVLVIGDGKLGLLVAMVLRLSGHQVFLRGHHDKRLDIVHPLGVAADPGGVFPAVVDCSGSPEGFAHAVSRSVPQGLLVLKSTFRATGPVDVAGLVINEITLVGSRCGDLARALTWLPRVEVYETLSRMHALAVPFSRAEEAVRIAAGGKALKVLLDNLG